MSLNPKQRENIASHRRQTTRIRESSEENENKEKNGEETLVGSTARAKICYKVFCLMTYIVFILFLLFLVSMVFFFQLLQLNCCIHVLLQLRSSFSGSSFFSPGNINFYLVFLFLAGAEENFFFFCFGRFHSGAVSISRWRKYLKINIRKSVKKNYIEGLNGFLLEIPLRLGAHTRSATCWAFFLNVFFSCVEVHYSYL